MEKATIVVHNNSNHGFPEGSDIDVGYNGIFFKIQEGKEVKVPVGVVENIENAVIRIPKTAKSGQLLFDKDDKMIFVKHKRYLLQILKDPRKKKVSSTNTKQTEDALEKLNGSDDIEAVADIDADDKVVVETDGASKGILDRIIFRGD